MSVKYGLPVENDYEAIALRGDVETVPLAVKDRGLVGLQHPDQTTGVEACGRIVQRTLVVFPDLHFVPGHPSARLLGIGLHQRIA